MSNKMSWQIRHSLQREVFSTFATHYALSLLQIEWDNFEWDNFKWSNFEWKQLNGIDLGIFTSLE